MYVNHECTTIKQVQHTFKDSREPTGVMEPNPLITSKLNMLLFTVEIKGKNLIFTNFLNDQVVVDMPKKYQHNNQRLCLLKDGKRLKKSQEKRFSQCYKLENYMLQHLGPETYEQFHRLNPDIVFYDIMDKKIDYVLDSHRENVEPLLQSYRELQKIKRRKVHFYFHSTGLDSINVLNHIAAHYPLIKQGYKYSIKVNHDQAQVNQFIRKKLQCTNKETTNYMLF